MLHGIDLHSLPVYLSSTDLEEQDTLSSVPVTNAMSARLSETAGPPALTQRPRLSLGGGEGLPPGILRHQCRFCPYASRHRGSLVLHERVHTGERPFRCHLCSRGFAHRSHVVRHLRTHTGERPFRCPLCPAAFSQRSNVKVHLRSHGLHAGGNRQSRPADTNGATQQAPTLHL
ncbi:hypothetical protein HPB49_002123 [Dermacentor silvarum]|uniref:Uncharacterized protein n=2 Tax=Dermacentor silvarum TaxID=543639 RepID=A0ACB8DM52_DERSI|nr:hypothetical protein HPB49_002123 [Dermacentor silvarum]